MNENSTPPQDLAGRIAIIGLAGRFPGARNVAEFWRNLCDGAESVSHFSEAELEDWFSADTRRSPEFVKARPIIADAADFDAEFFGMHAREAALTDPQQRLFLECVWQALEDAGYDPAAYRGAIGVFAGCSINTYFLNNVCGNRETINEYVSQFQVGCYPELVGAGREFLSTRASYKLDLRGPAMTVQTACSTSLVATAQACQSLLLYQSDMALAGGVSVTFPQKRGYVHQEGGMVSADGRCRPFDAGANGTIFGDGAGVVLLKRLEDALADRDHIYAVIRGCGLTNDGSGKAGFTAPSVDAQAAAIEMALNEAGVDADTIGYVECHGTATPLGDPIEIAALTKAFRQTTPERQFCAIGSVKSNMGHLDAAAGAAGLIKTALALKHGVLPPTLHYKSPNPHIDFAASPFFVNAALKEWRPGPEPRRAGVSALGVGGTNAHVVLEEAPPIPPAKEESGPHLLLLSARTETALASARVQLAQHIEKHPHEPLADIAYTLRAGRRRFAHRHAVVCKDRAEAMARLTSASKDTRPPAKGGLVFMFPGQGSQYPNMGRGLYDRFPEFRASVDTCAEFLAPHLGRDLREVLYPPPAEENHDALMATVLAQPAIFTVEYATARLWLSWGLEPQAMIGHSIGEFVAACLAGVLSVEDALRVVAARGRLMQDLPPGGMLAVRLPEAELLPLLGDALAIAAINGPSLCVVSGPHDALAALEGQLEARGAMSRHLHTSHAFHSHMVEPVIAPVTEIMQGVRLSAPQIPCISCVTGGWLQPEQAMSADYWARHARVPVRFADGVTTLLSSDPGILLEAGPGNALCALAAQTARGKGLRFLPSLPEQSRRGADCESVLEALGELWCAGLAPDWDAIFGPGRRISLPTYPFERKRYWIEPPAREARLNPDTANGAAFIPASTIANQAISIKEPETMTNQAPVSTAAADPLGGIQASILNILEELSGEDFRSAPPSLTFLEMGFDSLFLSQVAQKIQSQYKIKITFRQLLGDQSTIPSLAAYISEKAPKSLTAPRTAPAPQPATSMPAASAVFIAPVANGATPPQSPVEGVMRDQLLAFQQLMNQQLETLRQMGYAPAGQVSEFAPATVGAPTPTVPAAAVEEAQDQRPSRFNVYKPKQPSGHSTLTPAEQQHIAALTARFTKKTAGSKRMAETYRPVLADPRAVSGFRAEWKELVYPIVGARAHGSRIWDIDGNEYIDLVNGYGQTALGHAPDYVVEAVREQLDKGFAIGPQAELAGEVATLFTEMTGHERMTFCNTGSEAVMAAMRVARCVTGREKVVVFNGDYHGQFDEVLLKGVGRTAATRRSVPIAPGIPHSAVENMIVLDYGTPETLKWLEENVHDLAAVMVEPVQSRHPSLQPFEFLRRVRQITEGAETAFIMDEVVTGFRVHPGGIQALTGIRADMATYGKVVGGGMPIGVLAGNAKFMDALDGGMWRFGDDSVPEVGVTFFAGTFVRHPLVLAAMRAVLRHLKAKGTALQDSAAARASALAAGMNRLFPEFGMKAKAENFSSFIYFSVAEDHPLASLLFYHMRDRGIYIHEGFPCFLTTEHGEAEIEKILWAMRDSLEELRTVGIAGDPLPAPAEVSAPLTESQIEVWLSAQLSDEASCAFNESVTLRLNGPLDQTALQTALNAVLTRHDALRGRFSQTGEAMLITPELRLDIPVQPLSGGEADFAAKVKEDACTPFDLTNGPLVRASLYRLAPDAHALIVTAHHIICDGWSFNVVISDLCELYAAQREAREADLPEPLQFSEYARRQTQADAGEKAATEAFWLQEFADVPPLLDLPTDRPRPAVKSSSGASLCRRIGPDLYQSVKKAGARQRCTLFVTLLAAFEALLGRLAGQNEAVIGVPTAGQSLLEDETLVGHCVNFLPIRGGWNSETTVAQHLASTAKRVLDAYEHQNYTFGTLVRKLSLPREGSRLPLTEMQFNLERLADRIQLPGLAVVAEPNPKSFVNFDIFFNIIESADGLRIDCDYNTDLFDEATINRWFDYYETLLASIAADPTQPLANVQYVPASAKLDIGIGGQALDYLRDRCIHQLFEAQAAEQPNAIAVVCGDVRLTYAELDARANRLANHLRQQAGGKGERIGVLVDRSADMLVALLATLKAGYGYIPLDPSHPAARLRDILAEAEPAAVIIDADESRGLVPAGSSVVDLLRDAAAIAAASTSVPVIARSPQDLAYIIYTSGSTGKPKGVEIAHQSVINMLNSMAHKPGLSARDTLLAVTTIAFDTSVADLYLPLAVGAKVIIATREEATDGFRLQSLLENSGATFLQATPATWRLLLEAGFVARANLTMISTGEALPRDLANRLLEGDGSLWNFYGPTETTVWASGTQITAGLEGITVGLPIANTQFYILDSNGQPVLPGVTGELLIGGDGLARGYFKRPALTAEKFIANPFGDGRLYRTGDLARFLPSGETLVLGRIDHQVKLRGFRIELGEIEAVLRAKGRVADAAVILREDTPGNARLTAYWVEDAGQPKEPETLRALLAEHLPEYMIPAAWMRLDRLPLSPNGKVDRAALPAPENIQATASAGEAPCSELEEKLVRHLGRGVAAQASWPGR